MSRQAIADAPPEAPEAVVADLMARARAAMGTFGNADQARVDEAVRALAWALYKPENARALAEMAVADTGLGNVPDKVVKNQRKTFGALRDLLRARSVGIIEEDPARGLVVYAKPVGVVAAITPSTNPAATPINKAMMALKGRNAVVVAPSPAGWPTTARAIELARAELDKIGLPADLVQVLPRAVQRSLLRVIAEQPVESADGISISRVGHVGDVVGAHDVGGETADASENAGVFADATGVLAHGDITRIVVPVFNPPVCPDGAAGGVGGEHGVRHVVGGFAGQVPEAGRGVAFEAAAVDPNDGGDKGCPFGVAEMGARIEDLDVARLVSRPRGVDGLMAVERLALVA